MQFDETKTYKNLARSFAGESQAGMRYQLIARAATQQGYIALAEAVKVLAKNETVHARRFMEELQKRGQCLDNIKAAQTGRQSGRTQSGSPTEWKDW